MVAERHMTKLRRGDFDDPQMLAALAATARTSIEGFRREFEHLLSGEPAHAS
jgi:hypothetical protein